MHPAQPVAGIVKVNGKAMGNADYVRLQGNKRSWYCGCAPEGALTTLLITVAIIFLLIISNIPDAVPYVNFKPGWRQAR